MGNCSKVGVATPASEVLSLETQVLTSDCTEDAECWTTCPLHPMSVTSIPAGSMTKTGYDRAFFGYAFGHRMSMLCLQLIYIGRNMVHNRS